MKTFVNDQVNAKVRELEKLASELSDMGCNIVAWVGYYGSGQDAKESEKPQFELITRVDLEEEVDEPNSHIYLDCVRDIMLCWHEDAHDTAVLFVPKEEATSTQQGESARQHESSIEEVGAPSEEEKRVNPPLLLEVHNAKQAQQLLVERYGYTPRDDKRWGKIMSVLEVDGRWDISAVTGAKRPSGVYLTDPAELGLNIMACGGFTIPYDEEDELKEDESK